MGKYLLGNETANEIAERAASGGQFAHAYLFYGENGLGKRTLAEQMAQALLCRGAEKPCGECPSCVKVLHGNHPDLQVVAGGEAKNSIHIETVREIRRDCAVKPNEGAVKIYLITNIHNMTMGAFNAFLKTLEEPPLHTVFLLTAPSRDVLPETVLSRLMPVPLYPVSDRQTAAYLAAHYPDVEMHLRERAAVLSAGNIGNAVTRITDPAHAELLQALETLGKAVAGKREYDILKALSLYEKDKDKLILLCGEFIRLLSSVLRKKPQDDPLAVQLSAVLTTAQGMRLIELLERTKEKFQTNASPALLTCNLCAKLWTIVNG